MRAHRELLCVAIALAACEDPTPPTHPRPPHVVRFDVTPFEVPVGAEALVAWTLADASTATLEVGTAPRLDVPVEGTRPLIVTEDTALVLVAEGPGGTTRAMIHVSPTVSRAVAITNLSITPARARPGDPVEVSWATANATRLELRHARGGLVLADPAPTGRVALRPSTSLAIELVAEGFGGPLVRTASVTISAASPIITRFEADPPVIDGASEALLEWSVLRATHVEIEEVRGDGSSAVLLDVELAVETGSIRLPGAGGSRTLVLRASGPGGTASESTRLVVREPRTPVISRFTATPTISGPGGDVVLAWETRDAAWVELDGGPFSAAVLGTSGQTVIEVAAGARIELSAHGAESSVVAREARTIGVDARRPELALQVTPLVVPPGDAATITWQTLRAERVELSTDAGLVVGTSTAPSGVARFASATSAVLVARAWNAFGATTRLVPLDVAPPVTIRALSVSATVARSGRPVAIRWRTDGATGGVLRDSAAAQSLPLGPAEIGAGERWVEALGDVGRTDVILQAWNTGFTATASVVVELLSAATQSHEAEPNDQTETANGPWLGANFVIEGVLGPSDLDLFAIDQPYRGRIVATTAPASGCVGDVAIELYEQTPSLEVVGPVHVASGPGCAVLDASRDPQLALSGRSLVVALRAPGARSVPVPYTLDVRYEAIACGDGVVDRLEACDDGGTTAGDGCSATCSFEDVDEVEPNQGTGNPIVVGVPFTGFLTADDLDQLSLAIGPTEAGPIDIVLESPAPGACTVAARLSLVDATGRVVAESTGSSGVCPRLDGPALVLAEGTYGLFVEPAPDAPVSEVRGRYGVMASVR